MTSAPPRRGLVLPSVAAACAFAVLIGLGTWQVERLAWKEALIATLSERFAAPPAGHPDPEYDRQDGGQPVPGNCIPQVVLGE